MDKLSFVIAAVIAAVTFGLEIKREMDIRKGSYKNEDSYKLGKIVKKKLFDRWNSKSVPDEDITATEYTGEEK